MDHLSSNILMCAMLLLFYASGTVEGVGFGDTCSDTTACDAARTECISSKCACLSTAYNKNDTTECVAKIELDAGCTDSGEPAAQCIDNLAVCKDMSGFKCLCKDDNYKSGSVCKPQVDISGTCEIDDTATDQCSDTKTACSDDGNGAKKCLCTSDYYLLSGSCVDRKAPGEECSTTDECVTNAMCSTNCTCNTGYTTTSTSCESSDAAIIIAHMYVFIFGIVASLYFLV